MTHRVLVVEDELITAADIQSTLEGMGYDVPAIVDNGEEAIRKTGELHPSLVLMDIGLKGRMNGIEAAKQIRERFDIPVVYLTAHSDESTFWNALESQPFGYIIKPFGGRELQFGIEMALHKHEKTHTIKKGLKKLPLIFIILCVAFFMAFMAHPFFNQAGNPGPSVPLSNVINPPSTPPATPTEMTLYAKNVEIVKGIAQEYQSTHTYLGVQTGQSGDMYVCIDMAKDVWNMIKTRGINAVVEVGNVGGNITTIQDVNHAWVLAEVGPMQWLAVETTGGFVVTKDENPRYYTGMQFDNPADMKEYICGKDYCWSNTCVNDQCQGCNAGSVLGTDLQCHPECGSIYCTGNSVCVNGKCQECNPGYVLGTDNGCHPPCIDSNHYCLQGYVCGIDNKCHPASENAT
jgi:CheY-like chemotaxis protein